MRQQLLFPCSLKTFYLGKGGEAINIARIPLYTYEQTRNQYLSACLNREISSTDVDDGETSGRYVKHLNTVTRTIIVSFRINLI